MATQAKDVIVLGSGPGGYVAAIRAAQLGRKVTIVEREALGGVCLNWGCIPTKALLRSATMFQDISHAAEFGIQAGGASLDFAKIIDRSRGVAAKLSQGVGFLMRKNKIEVAIGNGVFKAPHKLEVAAASGTDILEYKEVIIATGARPKVLSFMEVDGDLLHTSRTILECRRRPENLLVVGAGAIGVEFAYFFNALGTRVTLVEMLDRILPIEDHDIADGLRNALTKQGITIKTRTAVGSIRKEGRSISATLKGMDGEESWSGDACLVAIGVTANTDAIGLEQLGIKLDRGFIDVDEFMRTNIPHHYAIGDAAGAPWLAHVASHEGITAAEHLAGVARHPMSYDNIPGCTYCRPQVASVGLTEHMCKERGIKYKTAKVPYSAIGRALATGEPEGFIKVIIDPEIGEVLGVHILHAEATELISEAAVIRSHEGIASSVVDTIHPHPTLSESIMEAMAAALGRPINT